MVDLREVAEKLHRHQFQEKAKLLENVDKKAMFVTAEVFAMYWTSRWVGTLARLVFEISCGGAGSSTAGDRKSA